MTPLLTAIQSAFTNATTITTVITGGLHLSEAAEGTAMPFAELDVVFSETGARMGLNNRPYECEVMFKAYDNSATAAMTDIGLITAVFDDKELTLTSGHQFFVNRVSEPFAFRVPTEERVQRDANVNPVYCAIATYRYAVNP